MDRIKVPSESKYFLQCQVTSHHAQYTWLHDGKPVSCSMTDQQCLLLIDSMGPEKVGSYVSQKRWATAKSWHSTDERWEVSWWLLIKSTGPGLSGGDTD